MSIQVAGVELVAPPFPAERLGLSTFTLLNTRIAHLDRCVRTKAPIVNFEGRAKRSRLKHALVAWRSFMSQAEVKTVHTFIKQRTLSVRKCCAFWQAPKLDSASADSGNSDFLTLDNRSKTIADSPFALAAVILAPPWQRTGPLPPCIKHDRF